MWCQYKYISWQKPKIYVKYTGTPLYPLFGVLNAGVFGEA